MNYLETIELYVQQGAYESAAMVCENAAKATGVSKYTFAANRLYTAAKYGADMQSSARFAANDGLMLARDAAHTARLNIARNLTY